MGDAGHEDILGRSSADEDHCIKLAFPTESAPDISLLYKFLLLEKFLKFKIFDISCNIDVKVIIIHWKELGGKMVIT